MDPLLTQLMADLAGVAARNTASKIYDKVRSARASNRDEETIASLQEIIDELIEDKNEAVRIARAYEDQLSARRLAPGDIKYIAETVLPIIEKFAPKETQGNRGQSSGASAADTLEAVRSLLSPELLNVLQLIGYNFRDGLGEPLTRLTSAAIANAARQRGPKAEELELARLQRETLLAQITLDPAAYTRWTGKATED
ncbi:hypothetical protein AABM35_12335 (plasmid) [Micrococcus luteus]|uniref:hypothetical protein n=1 Tax=Micrococcus luteus TaxID=1270 RepID=UPI003C30E360